MDLEEALAALEHPTEDGVMPVEAVSLILGAYKDTSAELTKLKDVSTAKISSMEKTVAENSQIIEKLKAENYDFFHAASGIKKEPEEENEKPSGIESLFAREDK